MFGSKINWNAYVAEHMAIIAIFTGVSFANNSVLLESEDIAISTNSLEFLESEI